MESPTKEEAASIAQEFHLHPLVEGEIVSPSLRPKVDVHKDSIYLILHFPAFRHSHREDLRQEVDFVIGKNFLITVHYDSIDAIHKFTKEFEVNSILSKHDMGEHAGFLFFYLITKLYRSLEHELEHIEERLNHAEGKIFKGEEDEMVAVLSYINRDLIDFKQALRTHKDVLVSLETAGTKFFGEDFSFYLQSITGEYYKVANIVDGHRETLVDLRETNDSLLTTQTGTIMKRLTFVSFATFPPMLIASLFGMNALHTPFIGHPMDFWIILGIMLAITSMIIGFFFYKKWL
jgi:magnesium transporter